MEKNIIINMFLFYSQTRGQTLLSGSDRSSLSPNSTYSFVGHHTEPKGSTGSKDTSLPESLYDKVETSLPESLYAGVERPARAWKKKSHFYSKTPPTPSSPTPPLLLLSSTVLISFTTSSAFLASSFVLFWSLCLSFSDPCHTPHINNCFPHHLAALSCNTSSPPPVWLTTSQPQMREVSLQQLHQHQKKMIELPVVALWKEKKGVWPVSHCLCHQLRPWTWFLNCSLVSRLYI